jgi:hypothetical protein
MTTNETRPKRLLTFKSGGWVLLLAGVLALLAAGLVLVPVWRAGGLRGAVGDGTHVESYGFELSNLTIPRAALTASGHGKDYLRAIMPGMVETASVEEVREWQKNRYTTFLVPGDRVVGVVLGGEARAYPLRVLNLHEMVNDVVGGARGGVPVGVSYSALCDAVVVFDRRVDGEGAAAVEFGNSGLLVSSNAVFYDRREGRRGESLWPQLALKAVAGPRAGKAWKLLPYELTTWGEWSAAHPETRVLRGLESLKGEYRSDPYNTYRADDRLYFPVVPEWKGRAAKKTAVVVTSGDGVRWRAELAGVQKVEGAGGEWRVNTYLFAWYAQHEGDTDYAAFGGGTGATGKGF